MATSKQAGRHIKGRPLRVCKVAGSQDTPVMAAGRRLASSSSPWLPSTANQGTCTAHVSLCKYSAEQHRGNSCKREWEYSGQSTSCLETLRVIYVCE